MNAAIEGISIAFAEKITVQRQYHFIHILPFAAELNQCLSAHLIKIDLRHQPLISPVNKEISLIAWFI